MYHEANQVVCLPAVGRMLCFVSKRLSFVTS